MQSTNVNRAVVKLEVKSMNAQQGKLLLSVDVEDWFQSENFAESISRDSWINQQFRVEKNVNTILEIFDNYNVKATFFCLGWIAERVPELISEIAKEGHEVASHGFNHYLVENQIPAEFRADISQAKSLLEDITGSQVIGYRAPSLSITDWCFPIIKEVGYKYDSSLVITDIGDRCALIYFNLEKDPGDVFAIYQDLYEFSLPCLKILGKSIPWGGGSCFRLFPLDIYLSGLQKIMSKKDFVFYFNSWEIDSTAPKIAGMSLSSQFRHYVNLQKTQIRLKKILQKYGGASTTFKSHLDRGSEQPYQTEFMLENNYKFSI